MSRPKPARLQKALAAGDAIALIGLLKDWPQEDLHGLLKEVDTHYKRVCKRIEQDWKQVAFTPENFFNPANAKLVDTTRDRAYQEAFVVCSEIISVAEMYLKRNVKKP